MEPTFEELKRLISDPQRVWTEGSGDAGPNMYVTYRSKATLLLTQAWYCKGKLFAIQEGKQWYYPGEEK